MTSRRRFLNCLFAVSGLGVLAACSQPAPQQPTPVLKPAPPTSVPPGAPAVATSAPAGAGAGPQPTVAPPTVAPATVAPARARLQLPTYTPAQKPAPDVPGTDIIPDGYSTYPKTRGTTGPAAPGKGGVVTVAGVGISPLVALEQNSFWQQLNKALNVNLQLNLYSIPDYNGGKLQTIIAGGDLPDFLWMPPGGGIPELPAFMEAKIQDLTPFVSGDAIKEWPNLAALPTLGWKGMVYNGKIFAVPLVQHLFYWGLWGHQELLEQNSLDWPTSADDFKRILASLTHPQQNQWGIGVESGNRYAYGLTNVGGTVWPAIMGAPNNWAMASDGTFTKDWETEQFKAAVALARDVVAAGSVDPNTNYSSLTATAALYARRIAFRFELAVDPRAYDSGTDLPDSDTHFDPPATVRLAPPIPAQAGGQGTYHYGVGNAGFVLMKKAPPERIKELLGILNYIAAPIGSQEDLIANYGVEGSDFNIDAGGNPVRTKQGMTNQIQWNGVLILPAPVLYNPFNPEYVSGMSAALQRLGKVGIFDPSIGLSSATNQKQGVTLGLTFGDKMIDIVAGREPLSAFDGALSDWRSSGGTQIKQELQKAYADSQ